MLSFALMAVGFAAVVWKAMPGRLQQTASQGAVLGQVTPTPEQLQATTFPEPQPVVWGGQVLRLLAGGRGAEVKSIEAPGGTFFAYDDAGLPASISAGPVLIRGTWVGISCEYGRCAPEVNVEAVEPLPLEPG
jgi:hypothetical protein